MLIDSSPQNKLSHQQQSHLFSPTIFSLLKLSLKNMNSIATSLPRLSEIHSPLPQLQSSIIPGNFEKEIDEIRHHESKSSLTPSEIAEEFSFLTSPISPKIRSMSNESPFMDRHMIKPSFSKIPIEDIIALREYLKQVDTKRYGFKLEDDHGLPCHRSDIISLRRTLALKRKISSATMDHSLPSPLSSLTSSPRDDSFPYMCHSDNEMDLYKSNSQSKGSISSPSSSPFQRIRQSSSTNPRSREGKNRTDHYFHEERATAYVKTKGRSNGFPGGYQSSSSNAFTGRSSHINSSIGPYKGRYGPNPKCASCQTTETPYWRDAWHSGTLLCNACGLRFAKFKRRCTQCNYVPRKEDKGGRQCPLCKGSWTQ